MLTSPLALRQEPFGRSVHVHTLGWRLSPRLWKSGVKQADGDDSQCVGHSTAPKHGRGERYPRKGSPKGWYAMSMVLVVDHQCRPCTPVHPGRARHLLNRGRAAVYRHFPFTIILREGEPSEESEPVRLKIDPGSQTTGLAVVNDATGQVVWAAELTHRGQQVKARLDQRRRCRRSRRQRHTRYRPARFLNRRRRAGR